MDVSVLAFRALGSLFSMRNVWTECNTGFGFVERPRDCINSLYCDRILVMEKKMETTT